MKGFKTKLSIVIIGLNLHHVLAYFEHEKFKLENLHRIDSKTLKCTIYKSDYNKFKKTAIFPTYKVEILKISGGQNILTNIAKRSGLFIGVIICLLTTLNLTNHVYCVHINNQNHVCKNQEDCIFNQTNLSHLEALLAENDVHENASINSLPSTKKLEQVLMKNFKQISGVSMTRKGVHVYIDIVEGTLKEPQTTNQLIAQTNGIVINLNVTSGEAKVKNGDIVLKGDVIVDSQNDMPVVATATLRTFYHESLIYNENQITYTRTGNTQTINNLVLFSLSLNSKNTTNFKLYESQTKTEYLTLNMLLPIKLETTTYYELQENQQIIPFSEMEQTLKEQLKEKTLLNVPTENNEIKNITYTNYQEGSRTRLDCYIETYLTITKKG